MRKLTKNDSLINKLLKKGKYIAIPLSIIMATSGLSACSSSKTVDNDQEISLSEESNEEYKSTTIEIGSREYVFDDDGATYIIENENDNMWEVSKDLNIYYKDIEEANDIDPYKLHIGDKIKIPKRLFNHGSKMGLFASESLGKIDWKKVSCVCDFAYINYYDFRNDYEDSNFWENVKGCEENNIPYGVVVYGGIKNNELENAEKIGKKDAKAISKTLEEINASLPTLFTLAKDGINYDNTFSIFDEFYSSIYYANETNGLVDFISNEESSVKAEKYCGTFLDTMKRGYSNFTILYTSGDTYDELYNIYINNYADDDDDDDYESKKSLKKLFYDTQDYTPTIQNQIIFNCYSRSDASKQCLDASFTPNLLGVEENKYDEVNIFYDNSTSDKFFTISNDFRKVNDDLTISEVFLDSLLLSLSLGLIIKLLNDLKKTIKENKEKQISEINNGVSKIKKKKERK